MCPRSFPRRSKEKDQAIFRKPADKNSAVAQNAYGGSDGKELSSFRSSEEILIKPASTTIAFPSRSTARSFGKRRPVDCDPPPTIIRIDDRELSETHSELGISRFESGRRACLRVPFLCLVSRVWLSRRICLSARSSD